ncbi:MAG TPA: PQQ-binding-like beta-propeller repeat protein [Caldisericia bacterium]|nr:PQQ-binding-like beta-propeller repeat protein [Caldisericia bacterium]HPF49126.1 PQQ-binding-like beta-propeller repeat protein [Caldisericia bacterium]HPI83010.1 PQQ-binding-like beta-propeller repeat protein [Caldisericia bacterium]HPQ92237.1 PQQ-binding-like beta-propeller repeat protein [Caldisericia bacterium]HRV74665.1 PQQ-binding-like beta-propeller repeat protein [Caldisericia bacterium]
MAGRNRYNIPLALVLCAVLLTNSVAIAKWESGGANFLRNSYSPETLEPPVKKLAWTFKADSAISCPPVVGDDGSIYFGTEGEGKGCVYCVQEKSGGSKEIWKFPNSSVEEYRDAKDNQVWTSYIDFPQFKLTTALTLYDRNVYVPYGSMLLKLDQNSGKLKAYFDLKDVNQPGTINTAPIVNEMLQLIIFGTTSGKVYGIDIDFRDPMIRWVIPENGGSGYISNGIALDAKFKIFFGKSNTLYSYSITYASDKAGAQVGVNPELAWSYDLGDTILASPAISGTVVVAVTKNGKVFGFNKDTGAMLWNFDTQSRVDASPAATKDKLLVVAGKTVYTFNVNTGERLGRTMLGDMCYATPVVTNKYAYAISLDNKLQVINLGTYAVASTKKIGARVESSPAISNGKIFFGSESGELFAVASGDEDPKLCVNLKSIEMPNVPNYQAYTYPGEFFIENCGGKTLSGKIEFSRDWVSAQPPNFSFGSDDGLMIKINVDPVKLNIGKYPLMMTITTDTEKLNIPVVINIVRRPDTIIKLTVNNPIAYINGEPYKLDAPPWKASNGSFMVPLRFITEQAFDCEVRWIQETREIVIRYPRRKIILTLKIGQRMAFYEYEGLSVKTPIPMPYAPTIVNSRTFVPIEFIATAFDAYVSDPDNTIIITVKYD